MKTTTLHIATPGDTDIVMTRVFHAPRQLVFDAWTKPDLLRRWYGPPEWELTGCEIDLRVGGAYRFESTGPAQGMTKSFERLDDLLAETAPEIEPEPENGEVS